MGAFTGGWPVVLGRLVVVNDVHVDAAVSGRIPLSPCSLACAIEWEAKLLFVLDARGSLEARLLAKRNHNREAILSSFELKRNGYHSAQRWDQCPAEGWVCG